ncbi:MAG TPA: hypothetical protein VFI38_02365 [Candidatus Acidoferrum sp.]|nr:hypothetical protein [Candidatus Acidoferrum sp.]
MPRLLALALLVIGSSGRQASGGVPQAREATLRGYQDYVAKTEARSAESLRKGTFLWIDELPEVERTRTYENLKRGGVEMRRLGKDTGEDAAKISGGMIHDWEGLVFISGAKLEQVLGVLQDYNKHSVYYAPDVESAKIESRDGDHFRVYMRFRRKKIVTVVLNTEQDVMYFRDSATREHSRSSAVRIREVANPGSKEEKEKSPAEENGFLWQMETWWRMEERDGGVYVQNEAVTLTRDIPAGLGWLIGPFVTSIPKETLEFTMNATRDAVLGKSKR